MSILDKLVKVGGDTDNVLTFEIENKDLENKVFEYLYKVCTNV